MSKDFSGTTAPRILKFGTNVGYDVLYCVKENQPAAAYCLIFYFYFSPSKFSVTYFLASMRARVFKFCIHIESGQVHCGTEDKTDICFAFFLLFSISLLFYVKENQIPPTYSSLNFFIFLSLKFQNIKFFITLFCKAYKVET